MPFIQVRQAMQRSHGTLRASTPGLTVWDLQYCRPRDALTSLRETVESLVMPWDRKLLDAEQQLEGRLDARTVEDGSVLLAHHNALVSTRTGSHIAHSSIERFFVARVLSGALVVEQSGRQTLARPGDIALFDSERPVTLVQDPAEQFSVLMLVLPKRIFGKSRLRDYFDNRLLPKELLPPPLRCCLDYLGDQMVSASQEEVSALLDAIGSLLPLAAGCVDRDCQQDCLQESGVLRKIAWFVSEQISSPSLTPQRAADYCGISVRYLHKLFAKTGTTFHSYVVDKRLDRVRADLRSLPATSQSITLMAYRWGFSDLSTFHRVFKRRFGCSPGQFRQSGL